MVLRCTFALGVDGNSSTWTSDERLATKERPQSHFMLLVAFVDVADNRVALFHSACCPCWYARSERRLCCRWASSDAVTQTPLVSARLTIPGLGAGVTRAALVCLTVGIVWLVAGEHPLGFTLFCEP